VPAGRAASQPGRGRAPRSRRGSMPLASRARWEDSVCQLASQPQRGTSVLNNKGCSTSKVSSQAASQRYYSLLLPSASNTRSGLAHSQPPRPDLMISLHKLHGRTHLRCQTEGDAQVTGLTCTHSGSTWLHSSPSPVHSPSNSTNAACTGFFSPECMK